MAASPPPPSPRRLPLLIASLILLLTALSAAFLWPRARPPQTPAGFRAPEAYLWQRDWSPAVKTALAAEAPAFSRILILAAQIDWPQNQPRTTRIAIDWPLLHSLSARTQIAAALRVSTFRGRPEVPAPAIAAAVRDILESARAAGVPLAEIQLDVDAPTSQLPAYRQWLAAARAIAAPIPLTFTALPTWLNAAAFAPLARDAGNYVLQLHSLDHPSHLPDPAHPLTLCDLPAARAAIAKASRLGVPFRIALPTYTYLAAFNPDGSFAALSAENAPPGWGQGKTVRTVEADPTELANFVHELAADPPTHLQGILWYRLPNEDDRLNWSWPTLRAVMAGRAPAPGRLAITVARTADALYDIRLANTGETAIDPAATITLFWTGADFRAADALGNAGILQHTPSTLTILSPADPHARLNPGQSQTLGWLRLSKEADIHGSLDPAPAPHPDRGPADGSAPAGAP